MSRLLLKLLATNSTNYEQEHHRQVQGLIYSLLNGSDYSGLHSKKGFKFFSFSGLFPFQFGLRRGDIKNLIISSPNTGLISYLNEQFSYLNEIIIGSMKFRIIQSKKFDIILSKFGSFDLITASPIIQHIQPYMRPDNLKSKRFWSTDYSVSLFLKQLQDNLIKKYNAYYELEGSNSSSDKNDNDSIFYKSRFLKQISTKIFLNKQSIKRTVVIGTSWLFSFGHCSPILQFGLDAGLGGLNSLGFGFMNVVNDDGEVLT